jgi:membrane protease subunit HflK
MMLTGDLNVANVEWIVQYKINDPYKFLFKVRNVDPTFRDMSEATMRQVVGDRSVTEVLTIGREEIQLRAKEELQAMCDQYETGIEVLQLVLQDVNPPEPVRPSFNEVNQAIQERERSVNEALAAYNRVIPEARGKADQAVEAAEGYATERVNRAQGDADRFKATQVAYALSPDVTRTRLYLEALSRFLPKAGPKIMVDDDLKGLVPLLSLGGSGGSSALPGVAPAKGGAK